MRDQRTIVTVRRLSRPRALAQFRAWLSGYFWLPCPLCGEMFAGYEMGPVSVSTTHSTIRKVCCRRHEYTS